MEPLTVTSELLALTHRREWTHLLCTAHIFREKAAVVSLPS